MAAGDKSIVFDTVELKVVRNAVIQYEKSVLRMAAKPGQPDGVAAEYRRTAEFIGNVIRKLG